MIDAETSTNLEDAATLLGRRYGLPFLATASVTDRGVDVSIRPASAPVSESAASDVAHASLVLIAADGDALATPSAVELLRTAPHALVCVASPVDETSHAQGVLLGNALEALDLPVRSSGFTPGRHPAFQQPRYPLAVLDSKLPSAPSSPDQSFSVVAFMIAYNEEDIIEPSIAHLVRQGVQVHLIDNWSTDETVARASTWLTKGLRAIEQFPPSGPTATYDWTALLHRVEQLALESDDSWCVLHDVDEFRQGPWPDLGLRDSLYIVDRCGFDAIDHTVVEFRPVDENYMPGTDFVDHFRWFEFTGTAADRRQVKAWRNQTGPVSIAETGGHDVLFDGRRVFPYNFLLRHYPIRSQAHGEKKVFKDRRPRWSVEELNRGWHYQYRLVRRGHRFVRSPTDLLSYDKSSFNADFLLERLTGVGCTSPERSASVRVRHAAISILRGARLLPAYAAMRRLSRRGAARVRGSLRGRRPGA